MTLYADDINIKIRLGPRPDKFIVVNSSVKWEDCYKKWEGDLWTTLTDLYKCAYPDQPLYLRKNRRSVFVGHLWYSCSFCSRYGLMTNDCANCPLAHDNICYKAIELGKFNNTLARQLYIHWTNRQKKKFLEMHEKFLEGLKKHKWEVKE